MIHQTSTHVNELLRCVSREPANFSFNFFRKVVEYGLFTLPIIHIFICVIHTIFIFNIYYLQH